MTYQKHYTVFILCLVLIHSSYEFIEYEDYEDTEKMDEEQKICVSPEEYFQMKNATEGQICITGNPSEIPHRILHDNYFRNTPNVRELEVRWLIDRVDRHAFHNLTKLNILTLNMTSVSELPQQVFHGLPLTDIFIQKSKIRAIKPGTFDNLPTLESLTVLSSEIKSLTHDTVPHKNVTSLDYAYNHIEVIEPTTFNDITKLEYLILTENKISVFDFEVYLKDNLQLKILDMGSNLLSTVNKLNLPNLIELDLNSNKITAILPGAFNNCKKLEKLIVPYNKLTTFDANLLPTNGLRKLKLFDISDNQLVCISRNTLDLFPNLSFIFWGDNLITCECFHGIITWMNKMNILVSSGTIRSNPCGYYGSNKYNKINVT